MVEDLSTKHHQVSTVFPRAKTAEEWSRYRLTDEQVAFFETNGYLAGIRLLNDEQIEVLRDELSSFTDSSHPGRHLFYEYNANESADPSKILFHALGEWRITLTLPVLNASRRVVFVAVGEEKRAAVAAILRRKRGSASLPASLVKPRRGSLIWILDEAAAADL